MVSRVKTWVANETLTAADLNTEFNTIISAVGSGTADHIDLTDVYAWSGAHSWSAATTHTNTLTVGVNDAGHDVKFFGATSGQYMLWDESADELVLAGDTKLSFHDAAGGENIIATSDGHLEINAGTTLDITAPTVDLNSSTKFNIDTAAYDLNASGAVTIDSAGVSIDSSAASNLTTSGGALTITSAAAATWSTAAGALTLATAGALILQTNGTTEAMRIAAGGDVGIGTTPHAATGKVDVLGANAALDSPGVMWLRTNNAQGANLGGQLSFGGYNDDGASAASAWASISGRKENGTTGNSAGYVAIATAANGASQTEKMRISSSGDVGIGTASPSSILHAKIAARNTAYDASDWKTWSDIHVVNPQNTSGGVFPATGISFTVDANDYDNGSAGIAAVAGDADSEHALAFVIRPNGAVSKEAMRIDSSGNVFIGDTANANMTVGLTINMGANDDEILALKSSDVTHGLSDAETDTYATIKKGDATQGGVEIAGFAENTLVNAIRFVGVGDTQVSKSTSSSGVYLLRAYENDGTSTKSAMTANSNMFSLTDGTTTRFIFDSDGDSHQDVGTAWTNFDDEDDAMICRSVGIVMDQGSIVRSQFDDWGRDHKADLIRTGLIPKLSPEEEANGDRPLMNTTQLARLHNGAIWQLHEQMETMKLQLEEANAKLALLEMN